MPLTKRATKKATNNGKPSKKSLTETRAERMKRITGTVLEPIPKDIKSRKHPNPGEHFANLRIVKQKDAPKGHQQFPKIDPHCVDEVVYVIDAKERVLVWLATKMPDGRYAAWNGCSKCIHTAIYCTCKSGVLEPRTMRWMHDRITRWSNGATVEETKGIPVDYRPWEPKPSERDRLDTARLIEPRKSSKPAKKSLRKSEPTLPQTRATASERNAAAKAATADIDNLDLGAMTKKASNRAEEVREALTKSSKKSLRKRNG